MQIDLAQLHQQRAMQEASALNLVANITTQIFLQFAQRGEVNSETVEALTIRAYQWARMHIATIKSMLEEEKRSGKPDR